MFFCAIIFLYLSFEHQCGVHILPKNYCLPLLVTKISSFTIFQIFNALFVVIDDDTTQSFVFPWLLLFAQLNLWTVEALKLVTVRSIIFCQYKAHLYEFCFSAGEICDSKSDRWLVIFCKRKLHKLSCVQGLIDNICTKETTLNYVGVRDITGLEFFEQEMNGNAHIRFIFFSTGNKKRLRTLDLK